MEGFAFRSEWHGYHWTFHSFYFPFAERGEGRGERGEKALAGITILSFGSFIHTFHVPLSGGWEGGGRRERRVRGEEAGGSVSRSPSSHCCRIIRSLHPTFHMPLSGGDRRGRERGEEEEKREEEGGGRINLPRSARLKPWQSSLSCCVVPSSTRSTCHYVSRQDPRAASPQPPHPQAPAATQLYNLTQSTAIIDNKEM